MSTISSDGWIRIFDIGYLSDQIKSAEKGQTPQLQAIAEYDTKGTRLTCCALADGEAIAPTVNGKRKDGVADDETLLDGGRNGENPGRDADEADSLSDDEDEDAREEED